MSRIPESVIAEVTDRADGICEHCTVPLFGRVVAFHHRKALKHDGPNTAVNLMLVIGSHHNLHQDSIHSQVTRSRELGHIVPSWADPESIPVIKEEGS